MTHATKTCAFVAPWVALVLSLAGCQPTPTKPADATATKADDAASTAGDAAAPESKEVIASGADTTQTSDAAGKSNKVMLGSPELVAGIPGTGPITLADVKAWLNEPKNHEPLEFELPMGLAAGASQVQGLDKNPLTRAKIELGRQLYFDPRISANGNISCATCHDPSEGFAKHTQFGVGIEGQMGNRNSPVSYNRILSGPQFWDGRADSLEAQAVGPIANPIEMGNTHESCVECLKNIPGYQAQFEKIFGKLDIDAVGQALASFERTLVSGPSPFDYYERLRPFERLDADDIAADPDLKAQFEAASAAAKAHPMSDAAKRGRELYFTDKANCSACHVGANLTDEKFHNIGVGMEQERPDIGREAVSKDPKDHGSFKTPTVRNVALSAPYMHDGSQKTLEEVIEWYAKGGHPNPNLSEKIKKLNLTAEDKADLLAFLNACTGEFPQINRERLPE